MVSVRVTDDPWPTILDWARRTGFAPRGTGEGGARRFQKGTGLMVAPMMCEIAVEAGVCTIAAWVRGTLLARILSLFILPAEMHIRSGGIRAVAPRRIARGAVNQLLASLGAPPIG